MYATIVGTGYRWTALPCYEMRIFSDTSPYFGQDPFIIEYNGQYLLIESEDEKRITLRPFRSGNETRITLYENPTELQVWAPELHKIGIRWYIFYTSSDGRNENHRNYWLESTTSDPFGPYLPMGRLGPDHWGIDITLLRYKDKLYTVWSGWENPTDGFPQHLYISELNNQNQRIKIASPGRERPFDSSPLLSELSWEYSHEPILEGPQAYYQNNTLHLFYAANASWTQDYATGVLTLTGENLLDTRSWIKRPTPLFTNCGHGHNLPGTDLFVAHRKLSPIYGWQDREIFTQPLPSLSKEDSCSPL